MSLMTQSGLAMTFFKARFSTQCACNVGD